MLKTIQERAGWSVVEGAKPSTAAATTAWMSTIGWSSVVTPHLLTAL
jgi:hypothetical protein